MHEEADHSVGDCLPEVRGQGEDGSHESRHDLRAARLELVKEGLELLFDISIEFARGDPAARKV